MDNRYYKYGCPGINIDSRNLTNYYSNRSFEQFIRSTNNIDSAQDYKNFLQMNAGTIMERENAYIVKNNTCNVNGRCNPRDFKPIDVSLSFLQSTLCNDQKLFIHSVEQTNTDLHLPHRKFVSLSQTLHLPNFSFSLLDAIVSLL
jgi:hypothetical protein